MTAVDTMKIADIKIRKGFNVRQDLDGIKELAESIKILGVTDPVKINSSNELVAGFRRVAAAKLAGKTEVPFIRDGDDKKREIALHASENIAREQLSPAEEADAIGRMLAQGYSADGVAKALGMTKAKVTRRQALLEIPEDLRALWGPGGKVPLDIAPIMAVLCQKVPKLAPVILDAERRRDSEKPEPSLEDEEFYDYDERDDYWYQGPPPLTELARNPLEYIRQLERAYKQFEPAPDPEWPAELVTVRQGDRAGYGGLKDWKLPDELAAKVEEVCLALRQAACWDVELSVTEADMDAARAAGVTLRFAAQTPGELEFIFDGKWLAERVESDMLPQFEQAAKKAIAAREKRLKEQGVNPSTLSAGSTSTTDYAEQSKRRAANTREKTKEWKPRAEAANERLGLALLEKFSTVTVDAKVAKLFAEASLGRRDVGHTYGEGSSGARLAAGGLRYVMPGWQTDVPKPTKANPNKTKREYLPVDEAEKKLWEWFDQAKTPEEIFGRAVVIHAAAMWAQEIVVPQADRVMAADHSIRYVLPHDVADRLRKLVDPKIPAPVKQLVKEMREFDPDTGQPRAARST